MRGGHEVSEAGNSAQRFRGLGKYVKSFNWGWPANNTIYRLLTEFPEPLSVGHPCSTSGTQVHTPKAVAQTGLLTNKRKPYYLLCIQIMVT